MLITNAYTDDPIKYNNLCQAQENYVGVDYLKEVVLHYGTIIVELSGPNEKIIGDYFTKPEELSRNNLDSIKLCQGIEVMPFADPFKGIPPQYKTNARIYVLNEDIKVAEGLTTENSHLGRGGLLEIAIPNGKRLIFKALEDKTNSLSHTIIPINLNNYQLDLRLSDNVKKQLDNIKTEFSQSVSKEDGSLNLNNIGITKKAYDVIIARTKVHELIAKYNCLMKEYTDELQMEDKDLNYSRKVKDDIQGVQADIKVYSDNLERWYKDIYNNPNLLAGFSKEDQDHILNIDTCSTKADYEKREYLNNKAIYLESKLSEIERQQLNIPKDLSLTKVVEFKENLVMEKSLNDYYNYYISEDPYKIVSRTLLHTSVKDEITREIAPKEVLGRIINGEFEQKLLRKDLFCHLKNKDDLIEIMSWSKDIMVNKFCQGKFKEVNEDIKSCLDELNENIKVNGKLTCTSFDEKNKYLIEKINSKTNKVEAKIEFIQNNIMEEKIKIADENIMFKLGEYLKDPTQDKVANMDKLAKAFEINKYCNITMTIEKNKAIIQESNGLIDKVDSDIKKIELRKEVLSNVEIQLGNINKYKGISKKFDEKILFKKSYQNKFQGEKNVYNSAQNYLKAAGVKSYKELITEKDKLNKEESILGTLKSKNNNLRITRDKLVKDTMKQMGLQQKMMKVDSPIATERIPINRPKQNGKIIEIQMEL